MQQFWVSVISMTNIFMINVTVTTSGYVVKIAKVTNAKKKVTIGRFLRVHWTVFVDDFAQKSIIESQL